MVPRVRTRATMAILPSRGTSRVPRFGHRYYPDQPSPAADVSKQVTRSVFYRASPRFLTSTTRPETDRLSNQFSFADTRSHGPTALAHESIAPTGPLEHPHYLWRSRTDMYVLPSFVSQLTNCGRYNTVGFLLLFSIFQWRFEFTLRLHRRYALTSRWIRYHDCSLPSKHRPLSTLLSVYGGRQGK